MTLACRAGRWVGGAYCVKKNRVSHGHGEISFRGSPLFFCHLAAGSIFTQYLMLFPNPCTEWLWKWESVLFFIRFNTLLFIVKLGSASQRNSGTHSVLLRTDIYYITVNLLSVFPYLGAMLLKCLLLLLWSSACSSVIKSSLRSSVTSSMSAPFDVQTHTLTPWTQSPPLSVKQTLESHDQWCILATVFFRLSLRSGTWHLPKLCH